jgi:hypothetical protein
MVTPGQIAWATTQGVQTVAPVLRHIANVQLVCLLRLRYRPRTAATAQWYAGVEGWKAKTAEYEGLALATPLPSQYATSR